MIEIILDELRNNFEQILLNVMVLPQIFTIS